MIHSGVSLQYALTPAKPDAASHDNDGHWFAMLEWQWDSPISGGYGTKTASTVNPGVAHVGSWYQWTLEALLPLNQEAGHPGFRFGFTIFLDELGPVAFAHPLWHPH
jgi:hypothetical protein